ncbi:MAG: hypothetical protein K1X94_24760 [Sandaracinaceae bacterium]|nr:hypothetical protein [Sandaracinaceae bacterium]
MPALSAALLCAVACTGCGQEAVLDLQLMLPAVPTSSRVQYAQIQLGRAADHPFEAAWGGEELTVELGEAPTLAQWSVVTADPETDLHVKVLFCELRDCHDLGATELWYAIEHPFYLGRRTSWAACVTAIPADVPTDPVEVGRCEVHGCLVGDVPPSWCRTETEHYCETLDTDRPPEELSCDGVHASY